ncbi:hypothetical protein DPEC_G00205550 [Dallia pectoralis]|uniref:Uncharacterized protein n=1 Tax=Dallia pectoralis TaxID=75939 RepID=A0ACC2G435_DALPE|nr:hypothetical protein DPEC_G00205550 [Dallia pectoralis]
MERVYNDSRSDRVTKAKLTCKASQVYSVQSLNSLNDQIAHFMVTRPSALSREDDAFLPGERDTLKKSMALMRHLLMDAQVQPLSSDPLTRTKKT